MEAAAVGFGTYQLKGQSCRDSVRAALKMGYKLIDSATVYKNEACIGEVLRENQRFNDEIFLTSKLSPTDQGYASCIESVDRSLKEFQLNSLDLYLIHWPGASKKSPSSTENRSLRQESYTALEQCVNEKKIRYLGISNFQMKHINQVLESCDIKPYLLQNECHPLYYDQTLIDFCKENKIIFQAYSSFGSSGNGNLINHFSDYYLGDHLSNIIDTHNKELSQILLKWALQKGLYVIPKATSAEHIKQNFDLNFKLSDNEMDYIDSLKESVGPYKFCWDPDKIE
eukprot:NODE_404_length_8016_cov_1.092965.p4 type:complete len:284 gc:universal NODE_404_length_8016_cov_1.092965:7917-7066(-)